MRAPIESASWRLGDPSYQSVLAVSCASLREPISALACTPEPYRLQRQVSWASSLDQFLVSDALTGNRRNEAVKPRESMILDVAFVQAEGKLIDVAAKMFPAGRDDKRRSGSA
jgi:hypothetical protein